MAELSFSVNGLPVRARYRDEDIRDILLPLLRVLTEKQRHLDRRMIVFMAGPPAMGKSTLNCFLSDLSRSDPDLTPIDALGMDGFHYSNAYLNSHSIIQNGNEIVLRSIKGAPETFDVRLLAEKLLTPNAAFPIYDRKLHESVPDAVLPSEKILLIEGNWLLLDEAPWNTLPCDCSIFLRPGSPDALLDRCVARKIAGGFDPDLARAFVDRSDRKNIETCLTRSRRADLEILIRSNGDMEVIS